MLYSVLFASCWYLLPLLLRWIIVRPVWCKSKRRLDGMVAIVTGANTGLGKETALNLVRRGAKVYLACRNIVKAEQVQNEYRAANPKGDLPILPLDLCSMQSVRDFVDKFTKKEKQLDILVCNGGFGSFKHLLTEDNIESHLACNHLGHFLLMRLLMPLLHKSGASDCKSRIVVLSSVAHKIVHRDIDYEGLMKGEFIASGLAYCFSKLANLLSMRYLNRLLADKNVTINAVHPGTCRTDFYRYYLPLPPIVLKLFSVLLFPVYWLSLTAEEGAQTTVYAAVDQNLEGVSGKYLTGCRVVKPSRRAQDDEQAELLWRWSCSKTRLTLEL